MFKFKMWPVLATGFLVLGVGSYAIADDDDDDDENEVSVEIEATNDEGFRLEVEAEGTSLGFIDEFDDFPPRSDGDLSGEAILTDPDGNECEVEIAGSNNGVGFTPNRATVIGRLMMFAESGQRLVLIRYDESMTVRVTGPGKVLFVGCNLGPANRRILFPGDQTEVEIEEDS